MAKIYGNPIANCPKCGVAIGEAHPYKWCIACGEQLSDEIIAKVPELVAKQTAQVAALVSEETKSRNPPPTALCYLLIGDQQTGPYTPDQIRSMWNSGQVTANVLYWFEGLKEWFPVTGFCQQPVQQVVGVADAVAGSTIACSYTLAILVPLFGFFAGIYLVLKKQPGHGVACMALSVFVSLVLFSFFSNQHQ